MNKSAVDMADTTTVGWAAELVRNDIQGFLDELRPVSIFAQLAARSLSLNFGGANSITIPRRATGSGSTEMAGAFVGEGGVIPVKKMTLASASLNRYKMAVISTFTNELLEQSVPNIETLVRAAIIADTAVALDGALLGSAAAVAGVRPAGLLAGVTPTASAGATTANIITDIRALLAAMIAANIGAAPVLIMNSNRLLGLSTAVNATGQFMFRDEIAQGRLLGVPVLSSTTVPAASVLCVDANSFAAANDTPAFMISDQAVLTMANSDGTAPTQAGVATDHTGGALGTAEQVKPDGGIIVGGNATGAPTGASVAGYQAMSMYQQYATAIRMVLPTSWGLMRANSVAALSGVAW
jgi:HK97 family phage major capsid protein